MMVRLLLISALMAVAMPAAAPLANKPIAEIDIQRYAGQWHEIAHLPMFFQRHCVDSITATYTPQPDGNIRVQNACRTKEGGKNAVEGVAKRVSGQAAALKVRFAPDWLSWLPWVWADYWVIELDPDYQWAVVGGPGRKYMWVLSRRPSMDRALFEKIRERAHQRQYPVEKLVMAAPLD